MKIIYNDVYLAAGGLLGEPAGFHIHQEGIVEQAVFFRAGAMTMFARENVKTELRFSVTRSFGTHREAQLFATTHRNSLPGKATLILLLGEGTDTQQVNLQGAALTPIDPILTGVAVTITYTFVGGLFDTEDIPIPDENPNVKRFNITLNEADEYADVVFDTPFGSTPAATTADIAAPPDGYGIDCWPDLSTLTASGVRFMFAAAIPAAGYHLLGEAVL